MINYAQPHASSRGPTFHSPLTTQPSLCHSTREEREADLFLYSNTEFVLRKAAGWVLLF